MTGVLKGRKRMGMHMNTQQLQQADPCSGRVVRGRSRCAFTLIELLAVVSVVLILATISLVVGRRVVDTGRTRTAQNLVRVLDQTLVEYLSSTGQSTLPSTFTAGDGTQFPIIDARAATNYLPAPTPQLANAWQFAHPAEPSLALYMALLADAPSAEKMLSQIDAKLLRQNDSKSGLVTEVRTALGPVLDANSNPLELATIVDPWGNPLRIVHPAYHLEPGRFLRYFATQSRVPRPTLRRRISVPPQRDAVSPRHRPGTR
jgi:prepilin-type N-terminal cleavage/methylation domain-containing protein